MKFKKHIPNTVTSLNLLCGILSIVWALSGGVSWIYPAMACIAMAAIFDLLDGFLARLLGVSSPIGADLDSLADVISFGLAPATLVFVHITAAAPMDASISGKWWIYFPIFLLAVFAAVRLAKFNNDNRQHQSFIGLPVPANALFWVGLVGLDVFPRLSLQAWWPGIVALYALIILFCYLMVSEIRMFSFKVKHLNWRNNKPQYLLLTGSVIALVVLQAGGLAIAIAWYILLSLLFRKAEKTGYKTDRQ